MIPFLLGLLTGFVVVWIIEGVASFFAVCSHTDAEGE
jgi:hypothetical protein